MSECCTKSQRDEIPNGQNPEWTNSRIGKKFANEQTQNKHNSQWTKSQTDKIQNRQNSEFYQLQKYTVRIKSVLTDL